MRIIQNFVPINMGNVLNFLDFKENFLLNYLQEILSTIIIYHLLKIYTKNSLKIIDDDPHLPTVAGTSEEMLYKIILDELF